MGDWIYYVTTLSFHQVAALVKPSKELVDSESLEDLIQRRLTKRSAGIARYLQNEEQRFFNALVLAVYGGEPEWFEMSLSSLSDDEGSGVSEEELQNAEGAVGLLRLTGKESIFAIDGQHRAKGIGEAVRKDKALESEHVAVVFVGHRLDSEGKKRSRRLFTTLNKYAKPVGPYDRIALDEDDVAAILTRKLAEEHRSLKGDRLSKAESASIQSTDLTSVTTLKTVYDICNILIKNRTVSGIKWSPARISTPRPSDEALAAVYKLPDVFWTNLMEVSPTFNAAVMRDWEERAKLPLRDPSGGDLALRPIGQLALALAVRLLTDQGVSEVDVYARLAKVELKLSAKVWSGVLWNSADKTMITSELSKKVAAGLLVKMAGGSVDEKRLLADYRKLMANPEAKLPC
jgi:DNA sulfur modification protein DndB